MEIKYRSRKTEAPLSFVVFRLYNYIGLGVLNIGNMIVCVQKAVNNDELSIDFNKQGHLR